MRQFVLGALCVVVLAGAAGAWVWYQRPDLLPLEWRQENPRSRDYSPAVYRWRDADGVLQLTDTPPGDRPYETVRVDPDTNIVPDTRPRNAER